MIGELSRRDAYEANSGIAVTELAVARLHYETVAL